MIIENFVEIIQLLKNASLLIFDGKMTELIRYYYTTSNVPRIKISKDKKIKENENLKTVSTDNMKNFSLPDYQNLTIN